MVFSEASILASGSMNDMQSLLRRDVSAPFKAIHFDNPLRMQSAELTSQSAEFTSADAHQTNNRHFFVRRKTMTSATRLIRCLTKNKNVCIRALCLCAKTGRRDCVNRQVKPMLILRLVQTETRQAAPSAARLCHCSPDCSTTIRPATAPPSPRARVAAR
jgi:hypothetical protein